MKKRKGIAVLLILILSLAVTACGDRYGVKEGESYIYCMNTDKTGLVKVAAKISGNSAIKKAESVIDEMKKPTNEIEYTQAIPEQVKLLSCALKGSILEIDFSEEYYEVKSLDEKLMRAAIVQSLLQIDGIDAVSVRVEGEPLKDDEGNEVGLMNGDDIVDTTGSSLSSYQSDTLKLYFADQNGSKLVKQEVDVHYSSNVLKEKLIVEKLMQGPSEEGAYPTINPAAAKMKSYVVDGQMIVDVAKGIEEDTLMTLSQQISQEIPQADVAVLSGPTHAEEVGRKLPTSCVIGAKTKKTAEYLQSAFNSKVFRVYTSPDMLGIELGGSLKNVIALAAGIADGLGYGDNTKAALITRGIVEIGRLGVKMGGKFESFCGLTGIGDLIVTCASVHSRNRKAGYLMGQGKSMEEAMKEVNMVVEGVYSAKAAAKLAQKYEVPMPIVDEINKVLFEGKDPKQAVDDLMLRESKIENSSLLWEE